jgi:hypothetical protein
MAGESPCVVMDPSPPGRKLSDLARVHPADRTLQNLLGTLSAKLELCSRLPIFEYEAASEGHSACAATFQHLAAQEQQSFSELLLCLRQHLDTTVPDPRATVASAATGTRR